MPISYIPASLAANVDSDVMRSNSSRLFLLVLFFVISFAVAPRVQATTIQEMSFVEVVAGAELVFEGKVLRTETRMQDGGIRTYVTFEVLDVIKGDYSGAEISLHYLGGQVGTRRLQVAELQLPQSGEVGVYFVESLQETLVHPLVGWAQGHFVVDSGYVTSASHQPLQEIDAQPQVIDPNSLSKGVAKGVKVQEFHLLQDAMTLENFKAIIRDVTISQDLR